MEGFPMPQRILSESVFTGLSFLHKYRFLTITQFARITNFSRYHAAEVLRYLAQSGFVDFFGYTGIPGQGKTPKVYYVKRKGWELLCEERDLTDQFQEVPKETSWTPHTNHRLAIIDCLIALELSLRRRPHLVMVQPFLSYRMVKRGGSYVRETTDFVANDHISENKLVPDAGFILENTEAKRRRLYFLEVDLGSEQITSGYNRTTIKHKITQYDRYLQSKRYSQTYSVQGEFKSFTLLFVTTSEERMSNIRRETQDFPQNAAGYYRFTTFAHLDDFLGSIWKSRLPSDNNSYPLVQT
jgi:hypothetical protein